MALILLLTVVAEVADGVGVPRVKGGNEGIIIAAVAAEGLEEEDKEEEETAAPFDVPNAAAAAVLGTSTAIATVFLFRTMPATRPCSS